MSRHRRAVWPAALAAVAVAALAAGPPAGPPAVAGEAVAPRVAAIAFAPHGDPAADRDRLAARIREAHRRGARFVVAPELSVVRVPPTAEVALHTEAIPGATTDHFARLAAELGIWLALSIAERIDEPAGYDAQAATGGHYVTSVLLGPGGEVVDVYRKLMVERDGPHPAVRGSFHELAEAVDDGGGLRIGILAGADLQVGVPRLAQRGVELVLVTAAWREDDPRDWPQIVADLARRHDVEIAVADRPQQTPEAADGAPATGTSRSGVFGRDGVTAPPGADGMAIAAVSRRGGWRIPSALGLPATVPVPVDRPASPQLAEIGRQLFFDPGLSSTGEIACASCHRPELAFTDGRPRGVGVHGRQTQRNVPSLLNVAFRPALRWDGYASTLESFTKYPLIGRSEMESQDLGAVVAHVRETPAGRELGRLLGVERIELEHLESALAAYQRTLVSGNSPFDRYRYGGDESALDAAARRGLALFAGRAGCARCHRLDDRYALFVDNSYHFLGVGYDEETGDTDDIGLGTISTNRQAGFFLTPSLRNVAETAPYMHDGSLSTLDEVIDFYVRGGVAAAGRRPDVQPLDLSPEERRDLVAFLRSLTGDHRFDAAGRRLDSRPAGDPPAS